MTPLGGLHVGIGALILLVACGGVVRDAGRGDETSPGDETTPADQG
ncbi:MAG: hypothetical protein FJ104_11335, partial [Deltaproteobacteria bacterium]|nr:hypothetical protein [Deltaproteobacteria bacterium]